MGAVAPPLRDGEGGLYRGGPECDVGEGGRQQPVHTVDEGRGVEMGSALVSKWVVLYLTIIALKNTQTKIEVENTQTKIEIENTQTKIEIENTQTGSQESELTFSSERCSMREVIWSRSEVV